MTSKELTIECEEITRVETNQYLGNNIKVTLTRPLFDFVADLEAPEIICHMDADDVLKAIIEIHGIDYIKDWHEGRNK